MFLEQNSSYKIMQNMEFLYVSCLLSEPRLSFSLHMILLCVCVCVCVRVCVCECVWECVCVCV